MNLKIEGFVKGFMNTSSSLGEIIFPLKEMEDMKPRIKYFDFTSNGKPNGNGQLLLRVQYFYNMNKYFTDELGECQEKIYELNDTLENLKKYTQNIGEPFGLIYNGKMNMIESREFIEKSDKIIDEYEKERTNLFKYKKFQKDEGINVLNDMNNLGKSIGNMGKNMGKNIENFGKSIGSLGMTYGKKLTDNISFGGSDITFLILLSLLSFLSLVKRKDFVNFGIGGACCLFFILDKLKPEYTIIALGPCIGYDLLWLLVEFSSFVLGSEGENEIGLKRFTYIISLVNLVIKIILLIKFNSKKPNEK
jgi:hypothetical protein